MATLLVVDDQRDFCTLVRELLEPGKEFEVVGEAYDGLTALRLVEELQPEVVLLDVEMPGIHGLETASRIRARFPLVKVIVMSAYHEREYREAVLRVGALDFIRKADLSAERVRQACQKAGGQPEAG